VLEQKGGRAKLLNTEGITADLIDSIKLDDQEMDWYRFIRGELNTIFPKVNETLIKTSKGMKRLGVTKNYFPLIVDFNKSEELAEQLFGDTYLNSRGVSKGFTKTRNIVGVKNTTYNMNARDVYLNYARKTSEFINMEETIRDLQAVATDKKFVKAIGRDASNFIAEWLDTISRGGISKGYKRQWFEDVRDNIGSAILGFKISPIIKQPIAKITAGALLGVDHAFKHDIEYVKNNLNHIVDEVSLQQKFRTFDDPTFNVGSLNKYQQWGYAGIKALDKITSNNVWYSAYKKYFADNKLKFNLDEFKRKVVNDDAVKYADELVRKTQGSGEVKDIAQMFRGDSRGLWKSLFQFQSFVINQFQLLPIDMKNAIMKEKNPQKALNILTFFLLAGMAESYISSGLTQIWGSPISKEKDKNMNPAERAADSFLGQIPLINNAISVSKFGSSGIPIIDAGTGVIKGGSSIFTSKTKKSKVRGAVEFGTGVAALGGISGAGQLEQWLKLGVNEMDAEESGGSVFTKSSGGASKRGNPLP